MYHVTHEIGKEEAAKKAKITFQLNAYDFNEVTSGTQIYFVMDVQSKALLIVVGL